MFEFDVNNEKFSVKWRHNPPEHIIGLYRIPQAEARAVLKRSAKKHVHAGTVCFVSRTQERGSHYCGTNYVGRTFLMVGDTFSRTFGRRRSLERALEEVIVQDETGFRRMTDIEKQEALLQYDVAFPAKPEKKKKEVPHEINKTV